MHSGPLSTEMTCGRPRTTFSRLSSATTRCRPECACFDLCSLLPHPLSRQTDLNYYVNYNDRDEHLIVLGSAVLRGFPCPLELVRRRQIPLLDLFRS